VFLCCGVFFVIGHLAVDSAG